MPRPFLIDTDILIDYLRGHPTAIRFLTDKADSVIVSTMSVLELYAGARGQARDSEQPALFNFLELLPIVPISAGIAKAGGLYCRGYGQSHGGGLAHAVITAMAVSSNAALKTPSFKNGPMFEGLEAAYRK